MKSLRRRWQTAGIHAKILAPLTLLMLLSLLGSTIGFVISTNTTRNRIIDGQLNEDATRLQTALVRRQKELVESARLLAGDTGLIIALSLDNANVENDLQELNRRALNFRERFQLDQVVVFNIHGKERVNIDTNQINPALSIMDLGERSSLLKPAEDNGVALVRIGETWLLVGAAPVCVRHPQQQGCTTYQPRLGFVYTFVDLTEELNRQKRNLEIGALVKLGGDLRPSSMHAPISQATVAVAVPKADDQAVLDAELVDLLHQPLAGRADLSYSGVDYRLHSRAIELGDQQATMSLLRGQEESNAIVAAGFQVMLISTGLTSLLLLLLGAFIARSFTRPIHKLVRVAHAVASGDRSSRANMSGADELGQLGQAFDNATETIVRLLEQQARVSGELQAILQSIADGVLAVDRNERVILLNPAGADVLGRQADVLVGQPLGALTDTDDPVLLTAFGRVIDQMRGELHDADNAVTEEQVEFGARVVSLRSAPIIGAGGTRSGAVVVLQDITRAIEADRAKSEFIATASHELRTPLTSLVGYIDLFHLDSVDQLTEQQRFCMDALRRQSANMVVLVNDLLEMARIERGGLQSERRWVAPTPLIDDAVASLHNQIKARQIRLERQVEPDLPLVWADGTHLRRVVTNLLSNAVKYSHAGGQVRVRAFSQEHDGRLSVMVEIEDHGVGIRSEDQDRIFTRFFRSQNPLSVEAGGTGLGLTITRALVELHGGEIGFRSAEGAGSCFWFRLPAQRVEVALGKTSHSP